MAATAGGSPAAIWPTASAEAAPVPEEPPSVVVTTPPDLATAPSPIQLTPLGDHLLFNANHPSYGRELWRVEADGSGARLVADIVPGTTGADPRALVAAGDQVFFTAFVAGLGRELWRSDGTAEGTELVADIKPGPEPSRIGHLTALGDLVVFWAEDGVHGSEPWVSDGTPAGTRMLKDINPGPDGSGGNSAFAIVGDHAYFEALDPTHGSELWVTDGTPEGTQLVADINPGPDSSRPGELTAFGDMVAFRASDGVSGSELWISDGTASGTRQVADIREGEIGSGIEELLAVGNRLFFRANDGVHGRELWASDGQIAYLVKDIIPGFTGGIVNQVTMPQRFTALGDRGVVFVADLQLWVSDGTTAGTTMLAEILPGDSTLITAAPDQLTSVGGSVLFGADDGVHGRELWITDGTSAGTRLVADLNPGRADSAPRHFTEIGGKVFFSAADEARGFELWSWVRPATPEVDDPTATFDGIALTLSFPAALERPDNVTRTRLRVTADGVAVSVVGRDWSASEPDLIVLSILGGVDPTADIRVTYEPGVGDEPLRYLDGVVVPPFDVQARSTRSAWVVAPESGRFAELSLDGETWQRSTNPAFTLGSRFRGVATDGRGTWLSTEWSAAAGTTVRRSLDGLNWSAPMPLGAGGTVHAVASVPSGGWLAVGSGGNTLLASTDGTDWAAIPGLAGDPTDLQALGHDGQGRWVAVGAQGTILVSDDRVNWDAATIDGEPNFDRTLRGVVHGGGRWLAVADTALLSSTDGREWNRIDSPVPLEPFALTPRLLHDGDGRWLLSSATSLHTSSNGLDWESAGEDGIEYLLAGHRDGQWLISARSGLESCIYASNGSDPFGWWLVHCMDSAPQSLEHGLVGVAEASLDLAALEVSQAVQDWEGSVLLVQDKATVVRAHFDQTGPPIMVSGRLHGSRDGAPLPFSPLTPVNEGGQIEVVGQAIDARGDPERTLNFILPMSWRSGDVELRFESSGIYAPSGPTRREVSFVRSEHLELMLVRWGYDVVEIADSGVILKSVPPPAVSDMPEQVARLMDQFPIADIGVSITGTTNQTFFDPPSPRGILPRVRAFRRLDGCSRNDGCTTHYYAPVTGLGGGVAYVDALDGTGYLNDTEARSATGFGRQMIGHEVGHNFGLRHTPMPGPVVDAEGDLIGRCGSPSDPETAIHPYDEEVRPGIFRPALGPLGDPQTEIWGASPRFFGGDQRFAVIDPRETFALMGYCWSGGLQDSWIAKNHYLETFAARSAAATAFLSEPAGSATAGADHLLVSGAVDLADGTTSLDAVWFGVDLGVPESIVEGDHVLRLRDQEGVLLEQRFGFDAISLHGGELGSVRTFWVEVPIPDVPVTRLEILDPEGEVLTAVDAGATPLEVEVTGPSTGTVIDGDTVVIDWELDDPDGDAEVTYIVQHSADDGVTWTPLATGVTETSLVVSRHELAGSDQARVRVIATADLRTATDTSERFTIAGNAPVVVIERPDDGIVVRPTQLVTVAAFAYDPEDGQLDDDGLRWFSDLDSELGSGRELTIGAWGLSLGTHELTAIATDSDGQTATASISVQVGIPPGAEPLDDDDDPAPDDGPPPPGSGDGNGDVEAPGTPPPTDDVLAEDDDTNTPAEETDVPQAVVPGPSEIRSDRASEIRPSGPHAGRLPRTGQALVTLLLLATLLLASGTGALRTRRDNVADSSH